MTNDEGLNYHHLRYFWAVATDGNLTRTARRLRVSQSALSAQIRQLEDRLGEALFVRESRRLTLTEAGRIALAYADDIFGAGRRLLATLEEGRHEDQLRIGAVGTLSRNFLSSFAEPLFTAGGARMRLESGRLGDLLPRLDAHELDLVLSNRPPAAGPERRCVRIARQEVSLVGRSPDPIRFPDDVSGLGLLLPTSDSETRTAFDLLCEEMGLQVRVVAEVDDMALLRLLARDDRGVALLPSVVVRDELRTGLLHERCVVPGLYETFYAITVERRFEHPLLAMLLARNQQEILAPG